MTVRIKSHESNYFFHSHELREMKVEEGKITIRLTNNDIMTLIINFAEEIAKDIFEAMEKNEDMSFPVGQVTLR